MPTYVEKVREPTAREGSLNLITSEACRKLKTALIGYARGDVPGRSYLVSGHRGAGKTTLINQAIEDAQKELDAPDRARASKDTSRPARLILIKLSGPDLLFHVDKAPATPPEGGTAAPAPKEAEQGERPDALLEHMARALHREFTREIVKGYEAHVRRQLAALTETRTAQPNGSSVDHDDPGTNAPAVNNRLDLHEAGGQLALELRGGGAEIDVLRSFWDLASAWPKGVLFHPSVVSRPDQAVQELLTLVEVTEAFRIATGQVTTTFDDKRVDENKRETVAKTDLDLKKLVAPGVSLAGGALAALGVHTGLTSADAVPSFAALAAGLITASVLNLTTSRTATKTRTANTKYVPDAGPRSLRWGLPSVVSRLRDLGIAPVFVVDELDKLKDGPRWINDQVQELKAFVTEGAFFCFLAGRDYIETIHTLRREKPNSKEHTQFSDYLFVQYLPADLHDHLRKVLRYVDPPSSPDPSVHRKAYAALPYVMLIQSQLHPIDLRRQLSTMSRLEANQPPRIEFEADDGKIRLVHQFYLLMELAVEQVLEKDDIRQRLRDDARFAVLAYDTVLYPWRIWQLGLRQLETSQDHLRAYLLRRMEPDLEGVRAAEARRELDRAPDPEGGKVHAPASANKEVTSSAALQLSDTDAELLYGMLTDLLALIRDPSRLRGELSLSNLVGAELERSGVFAKEECQALAAKVLDLLPTTAHLLEEVTGKADELSWCFDPQGRPIASLNVLSVFAAYRKHTQAIDDATAFLRKISPVLEPAALASTFGLLASTPEWSTVLEARSRVDPIARLPNPTVSSTLATDTASIAEYSAMLQDAMRPIIYAVAMARFLDRDLSGGLAVIRDTLQLVFLTREQTNSALKTLGEQACPGLGQDIGWTDSLRYCEETLRAAPRVSDEAFWGLWRRRLTAYLVSRSADFELEWIELQWASRNDGYVFKPELLSTFQWTEIVLAVASDEPASGWSFTYPPWLVVFALERLGFPETALSALADKDVVKDKDGEWSGVAAALQSQTRYTTRLAPVVLLTSRPDSKATSWHVGTPGLALPLAHAEKLEEITGLGELLASAPLLIEREPDGKQPEPPQFLRGERSYFGDPKPPDELPVARPLVVQELLTRNGAD